MKSVYVCVCGGGGGWVSQSASLYVRITENWRVY